MTERDEKIRNTKLKPQELPLIHQVNSWLDPHIRPTRRNVSLISTLNTGNLSSTLSRLSLVSRISVMDKSLGLVSGNGCSRWSLTISSATTSQRERNFNITLYYTTNRLKNSCQLLSDCLSSNTKCSQTRNAV